MRRNYPKKLFLLELAAAIAILALLIFLTLVNIKGKQFPREQEHSLRISAEEQRLPTDWERAVNIAFNIISPVVIITILALLLQIRKNRKITRELEFYANNDVLTGVFNRRAGIEILKKEIAETMRQDKELTISFADINNLKWVNDNFGHKIGDELIRNVCEIIRKHVRTTDIITRFGGDEFLIIHPHCNVDDAESIWGRLNEKLDELNKGEGFPYPIGISYGITMYQPESKIGVEEFIALADRKMYDMKFKNK